MRRTTPPWITGVGGGEPFAAERNRTDGNRTELYQMKLNGTGRERNGTQRNGNGENEAEMEQGRTKMNGFAVNEATIVCEVRRSATKYRCGRDKCLSRRAKH